MGGQSSIITYSKSLVLFILKGDLYTRIRERNERYFTEVVSFIMSCDYNYLLTEENLSNRGLANLIGHLPIQQGRGRTEAERSKLISLLFGFTTKKQLKVALLCSCVICNRPEGITGE